MNKTTKKILSFALAATIMSGVPVVSHAEEEVKEESIEYVVKKGDTLGKIALRYYGNPGYWENLASYNNLSDPNKLSIGQVINVPTNINYDYENNCVEVETYPEDKTYTVKKGDTLYCIVNAQYGLKNQEAVDKLATYNYLSDPNLLSVGQVLLIPCVEKLQNVVQNDYSDEYNRMGWKLNHIERCHFHMHPPVCPPPFEFEPEFDVPEHDKCLSKTHRHWK